MRYGRMIYRKSYMVIATIIKYTRGVCMYMLAVALTAVTEALSRCPDTGLDCDPSAGGCGFGHGRLLSLEDVRRRGGSDNGGGSGMMVT